MSKNRWVLPRNKRILTPIPKIIAVFSGVSLNQQWKGQRGLQISIEDALEAAELKKKYFGPEGELYKKRVSLVEPIQEEIYNAVKGIATSKGFQLILDRASDASIIFASPAIDISNEVLSKLGYSK